MKKIEKKVHINAPVSKVWQVLTRPEHIEKWLMPTTFTPEKGADFTFTADMGKGPAFIKCSVKEIEENKKLVYSWKLPDIEGETLVSIELEGNGETEVTLIHTGWENLGAAQDDMMDSHNKGWDVKLKNLKESAEAK